MRLHLIKHKIVMLALTIYNIMCTTIGYINVSQTLGEMRTDAIVKHSLAENLYAKIVNVSIRTQDSLFKRNLNTIIYCRIILGQLLCNITNIV